MSADPFGEATRLRAEVVKLEVALEIARKKLQLLEEVEKLQEKLRELN